MRELEFLPADYIRARYQRRVGFIRSWLLLALGLAMVLWSFQMGAWVRSARAELDALHGTHNAVEADVEKVRCLQAETQAFNRRLELVRTLRPRVTVTEILGEVSRLLPQAVVLDGAEVKFPPNAKCGGPMVRLWGTAPKETVVTTAIALLDASRIFEGAVLVESLPLAESAGVGRGFVIEAAVVSPVQDEE